MKDHRIVQRGGTVHIPRIQIRTRSEQRLNLRLGYARTHHVMQGGSRPLSERSGHSQALRHQMIT